VGIWASLPAKNGIPAQRKRKKQKVLFIWEKTKEKKGKREMPKWRKITLSLEEGSHWDGRGVPTQTLA